MQLQANNINIEYSLTGRAGAPTVVLSHSLACNHFMWNPQLEILEKDYQVLAYDTRGHGNSDVTTGPYTLDQLADDVIAMANELKIDQFHWVGLSIGKMMAGSRK